MKKKEWSYDLVLSIFDKIADTKSSITKKMIIATYTKNPLFQKVVKYALNPFKTFKMSGVIEPLGNPTKDEFFTELFDDLESFTLQPALSKEQKETFTAFVQGLGDSAVELVNRILNKDLRCGAGIKTFKSGAAADLTSQGVFDDLPIFHPMKGESSIAGFMTRAKQRKNMCWSYKLDGTRCWAVIDIKTEQCLYLSFNGLEIPNFKCFDESFLHHANKLSAAYPELGTKIIYDGEVVNIKGDFSKHMSEFRRLHNMDSSGFRFRVFDIVVDKYAFKVRYERFIVANPSFMKGWNPIDFDTTEIRGATKYQIMRDKIMYLPHYELTVHPMKKAKEAKEVLGLEGIMLKTWNHQYQHKRSWDWCKVKVQYSEDLGVVDTFMGTGKYSKLLGGLIVNRAGVKVKVGSGFSDEERSVFLKQVPKIIEVEYQEITSKGALRFPRFIRVRDDK